MSFDDSVRLIWSLASSLPATSITASGNSGAYTATPAPGVGRTAVDLRRIDDVWLSVSAAGGSGTSLTVYIDAYDDQGNLFSGSSAMMSLTLASAPGQKAAFGGRHGGGGAGTYFVLPEWGRISWTLTGTMTGVEIALYAR
jgi:hypothetical protein